MNPRLSAKGRLVLAGLFALLFLYVVLPVGATIVQSVTSSGGRAYAEFLTLSGPGYRSLRNSVLFSLLTVLLSGVVGVPLALLLMSGAGRLRNLFLVLLGLPLLLPPIVGIVAIEKLVCPLGLLPNLAAAWFGTDPLEFAISGLSAALLVHVYSFQVYFVLLVYAGARALDPRIAEAARTLGASRAVAFRKAVWPALLPSVEAAAVLVFMSSMASFSAPYIFAPRVELLTVSIYQAEEAGRHELALARTVVLAAVSLLFVAASSRKIATAGEGSKGGGAADAAAGRARPWPVLVLALGSLLAIAPHVVLLGLSFSDDSGWSLGAYRALADDIGARIAGSPAKGLSAPFVSSVWMSLASLVGDLVIGVAAAYLIARRRFRGSGLLTFLLTIPWAIPGTSLAMALLTATRRSDPVIPFHALAGTVWLLPLGYFVRNLPLMARAGLASMASVPADVEAAGRTLGAGFGANLRKVVLPLAAPGLAAGGVMTLLLCLGEFVVSVLLFVPDNLPISVAILQARRARDFPTAAMYGGVLLLLSAVLLGVRAVLRRRGAVPVPSAAG